MTRVCPLRWVINIMIYYFVTKIFLAQCDGQTRVIRNLGIEQIHYHSISILAFVLCLAVMVSILKDNFEVFKKEFGWDCWAHIIMFP